MYYYKCSRIACVFLLALLFFFAGCTLPREERGQVVESENGQFPKVAVDYTGREVRFERPPESFASTLPSNTEILFALGLGDKVKAVTVYCDYPPEIREKSMRLEDWDLDKIDEMVPELILAGKGQDLLIDVAGLVPGVTPFVIAPQTFDEVVEAVLLIGEIAAREEKAAQVTGAMREKKEEISNRVMQIEPPDYPEVLILASPEEQLAAGRGTFADELLDLAGGMNAAEAGEGYYPLEKEELLEMDPEIIVFLDPWEEFFPREEWQQKLRAFQENQLYRMEGALLTRPGPRLAEGLVELHELLHSQ